MQTALVQTSAWQRVADLAVLAVSSEHSKRAYRTSLDAFYAWWVAQGQPAISKQVVTEWKASLEADGASRATVSLRLAAIRKLVTEAVDNGLMDAGVAASICRVQAGKRSGKRLGRWLSESEITALMSGPDTTTVRGARDLAILALLYGAALRRTEVVRLRRDALQIVDGRPVLVDIVGKGDRVRSVPIADWVRAALVRYWLMSNATGDLAIGGISDTTVYEVVHKYARQAGLSKVSPHDLRRTHAHLAKKHGAPVEQIQYTLGHASIVTTEIYLGLRQDLKSSPSDALPVPEISAVFSCKSGGNPAE